MASKISILLPCYNEAAGVARLDQELFPALESLSSPWEVIAVDDGSNDQTGDTLTQLSRKHARMQVFHHSRNRGLGAALRTGLSHASGAWIVVIDADLTFHPNLIPQLIKTQKETEADCVSGSPILGEMPGVSWVRRLPSLMLNAFYRGLLDRKLTSFTPMFRLYRATDLKSLQLHSEGFEISAEIIARFIKSGRHIEEIPVALTKRITGESKLRRWRELRNHFRLIWRLLLK